MRSILGLVLVCWGCSGGAGSGGSAEDFDDLFVDRSGAACVPEVVAAHAITDMTALEVAAEDALVYVWGWGVTGSGSQVTVFDATDPSELVPLGTVETGGQGIFGDLQVRDGLALLTWLDYDASTTRLTVIDVGDPTAPTILSEVALGTDQSEVHATWIGDFAFFDESDVDVVDLTDPSAPVGHAWPDGRLGRMARSAGDLVVEAPDGLEVFAPDGTPGPYEVAATVPISVVHGLAATDSAVFGLTQLYAAEIVRAAPDGTGSWAVSGSATIDPDEVGYMFEMSDHDGDVVLSYSYTDRDEGGLAWIDGTDLHERARFRPRNVDFLGLGSDGPTLWVSAFSDGARYFDGVVAFDVSGCP